MAYGTPASPDEVESYYTDIRRGRPPTPELLADLVARYEAIGGLTPLRAPSEAQPAGLQRALDDLAPDQFTVVLGYKHAFPRVEDAVATVAEANAQDAIGLVLAPHYSVGSVGEYHERAAKAATAAGVCYTGIRSWHRLPAYIAFEADAVQAGVASLPTNSKVVFTAHSLPQRIAAAGDPYRDELRATADAVSAAVGLAPWASWGVAYQSAGRTPEPWLGPDVLTVVQDLADQPGATGVLVVPCGFVADHLEVLYDLDIAAAGLARSLGLAFARTPVVNDDAGVLAGLAALVAETAADGGRP
jgi:ferrochelatase